MSLCAVDPVQDLEAVLDVLGGGQEQGLLPASQGQPGGLGEMYTVVRVLTDSEIRSFAPNSE